MFKQNLDTLVFIIFRLDSNKIEVKAKNIEGGSILPNLKIITRLDFDE